MNFLDKLVIPLSPEHLLLLHYIAIFIFFLFVPFISIILGGTALSLYYKRKGIKNDDKIQLRFAKDVMEIVTINKSTGIVLGILTLITSILIYIQLFHEANMSTVNYLSGAVILIIIGLILVYTYRYSLTFGDLFDSVKESENADKAVADELDKFKQGSKILSRKSGRYGIIFLVLGTWLFTAGVTLAAYPADWNNNSFLSVMFSGDVILRFIPFLLMAAAFTGATVLFINFNWDGGKENLSPEYKDLIKTAVVRWVLFGSVFLPLFLLINLLTLPNNALSYSVFVYSTVALLLLFLVYHYLYAMYKNSETRYGTHIFFVVLFSIFAIIIKDQLAMGNATRQQTMKLAANFEQTMQKLTNSGSKATAKISGKEIYENICSACHSFDHKVVGPPYEQTLPKYKGNVDKLVTFILNPTQNNPGYPIMPNPGLNREQAHAVATYILKEVKKYE